MPILEDGTVSEEVSNGILRGWYCWGCTKLIPPNPGVECFCEDELAPFLAQAHEAARWCSKECLYETHEEPKVLIEGYPALEGEPDD